MSKRHCSKTIYLQKQKKESSKYFANIYPHNINTSVKNNPFSSNLKLAGFASILRFQKEATD